MSFQFQRPVPQSITTSSGSGTFDTFFHDALSMTLSEADYDELIIPLSLCAFNRLSTSDQQEQLKEIRSHHEETDFTELSKKLSYSDQVKFLSKVLQKLKCERLIPSFKQLDAEHQQQVIEQMALVTPENLDDLNFMSQRHHSTEEDFRLRRFKQQCTDRTGAAHKLILAWKIEDDEQEKTFDDNENNSDWKSSFSEFFLGFSVIWFQGQRASGQDMLIEQLSKGVTGVVIEKRQQNESEEDFKLRRFTELCTKVTDFQVQEKFLNKVIQKLEEWEEYCRLIPEPHFSRFSLPCVPAAHGFSLHAARDLSRVRNCRMISCGFEPGEDSFDSEWIKIELPNLQGQGTGAGGTVIRRRRSR